MEWALLLQELLEPLLFGDDAYKPLTPAPNLGWFFTVDFQVGLS